MFEKSLGLRENPFLAGHLPKYVFPSREHQEALAHLRYGIQNKEPFVLITGEVGTGKTTAVYDALAEWGSRAVVALITNSALTRSELLEEICLRFGVSISGQLSKPHALVQLQRQLGAVRARGELAILLVDEAQNLDRELLEEIRLLSNLEEHGEYLLQIFLVGQPELETKLASKELRQLRQRIGIHYRILPLSATETARYVHHRVSVAGGNAEELFPADTCVEIFRVTNGIPREINIVAGQALLNAFVEDSATVTAEHVRGVEREIEFQSVLRDRAGTGEPAQGRPVPATPAAPPPGVPPRGATAPVPAAPAAGPAHTTRGGRTARKGKAPPSGGPRAVPPLAPETQAPAAASPGSVAEPGRPASAPPGREESPEQGGDRPDAARTAPLLPPWFNEIVERRQVMRRQGGEDAPGVSAVAFSAPAPAPPPTAPTAHAASEPASPISSHTAATSPLPRIAPHPSDPAPGSDQPTDPIDYLPARLRMRLEDDEEPGLGRRASVAWPIASIVIASLAIGVLLLVRFGPWTLQGRGAPGTSAPAPAAPRDSVAPTESTLVRPAGSVARTDRAATRTVRIGAQTPPAPPLAAPSPPAAAAVNPPAPVPAGESPDTTTAESRPDTSGAPATAVAPIAAPAAVRSFVIDVGTYLNEGRALAERTRLNESTQLPSRVVTVAENSVEMYRVVVGAFANRMAAERVASDLVQRGLVSEARVVAVAQAAPPPR